MRNSPTTPSHPKPQPEPQTGPSHRSWAILIWLLLTLFALIVATEVVRLTPCFLTLALIIPVAYPIWISQRESFLLRRRVLLTGVAREGGWLRRWFWNGHIGAILLVFLALLFATLLLAAGLNLTAWHWLILFLNVLFLAWVYRWLHRRMQSEVRPEMVDVIVRRWILVSNPFLLMIAFFVLNFFFLGTPDLRTSPWQEVMESAYASSSAELSCTAMGALVGLLAALEQGSWALAQQVIPGLPGSVWRIGAWFLFLLQLGILSFLVIMLQLGVLALVERRTLRVEAVIGESTMSRTFVLTILFLALPFMFAALQLRDLDTRTLIPVARETLSWADPCQSQDDEQIWSRSRDELDAQLSAEYDALLVKTNAQIDQELDQIFASMETGVDAYLDWYFTVIGEYQRLIALAGGNFSGMMADQLEEHLFAATQFEERLDALDRNLMETAAAQSAALSQSSREHIVATFQENSCLVPYLDTSAFADLERDAWRASGAAAGGTATGVATVALSKKVLASTVTKVAAKESFKVATAMAAKMAAKKGTGVLAAGLGGAALCAASGPGAVLCGVGAATAAWLAIDKVAIEIDEHLSRESMRADILEVLSEEQEALRVELQQRHRAMIGEFIRNIDATIDGLFIPARDGL